MKVVQKEPKYADMPLSLLYREKKGSQEELPDHLHDWYEFIYIHEGNARFFIDQNFYNIGPGDLILVPPNTIHRMILEANNKIVTTAIFFSKYALGNVMSASQSVFFSLYEHSRERKEYKYCINMNYLLNLESHLEIMNREYLEEKEHHCTFLTIHLHWLLLFVKRHGFSSNASTGTEPNWIRPLLIYIEENITNELSLHEMASYVSISPTYLSRSFKSTIGLSLSDYIMNKRIELSKNMLTSTTDNIENIAEKCGYNSMPHFYRTFKRKTSITPHEYRKNKRI